MSECKNANNVIGSVWLEVNNLKVKKFNWQIMLIDSFKKRLQPCFNSDLCLHFISMSVLCFCKHYCVAVKNDCL